jgi:hypothetical protein
MKKIILSVLFFAGPYLCFAQTKRQIPTGTQPLRRDTTRAATPAMARAGIKPFESVITPGAISKTGLFSVHKVDDRYYFEIADSLLGREFLAITRYSKTPGNAPYYGGELANQQTMYWEKGQNKNLLLRVAVLVNASSDTTQAIYKAVQNSNVSPIIASFDVKAYSKTKNGSVIDVTDFFKADNQVVSIDPQFKQNMKLGAMAPDRSFIQRINTFPINTEIHTVKTYGFFSGPAAGPTAPGSQPIPAGAKTGALTFELNTSFLLLPKVPMQKRYFDERVGYFADQYSVYADDLQKTKKLTYAVRWRLEPKPEDREKYNRGELVEPKKPIVYYIDPATPKKWVPYLIAGINDWGKAFEQAGFKNAISAKEWPVSDTTMSMEDARYSVVRYFASPISNAYGPNIHDPRSGEILESHIGWYHNVMSLVHDWYMVQAGAIDPRARKMNFDDELMGNLIRFVSSHEIGHTLGLRHNFGASHATPVEKLRDKAWVEANGHTVSIMDYARFNYVAQPEDHVGEKGIFPRIGAYDKWAIEWGYKLISNAADAEAEQKTLLKTTTSRLESDPRLWFGQEPSFFNPDANDPRSQSEDLSDDPVTASDYGIKNLKRVMKGLPEWTKEEDDFQDNLQRMQKAVLDEYRRFIAHVGNYIGSRYINNKTDFQKGPLFTPVSRKMQKRVVDYYTRQVFETPKWLISSVMIERIGLKPVEEIKKIQETVLGNCTNSYIMMNIIEQSQISKNPYTLSEYIKDLERGIWGELDTHGTIDIYRRNLQKMYIERLVSIIKPQASALGAATNPANQSDVASYLKINLGALRTRIQKVLPSIKDQMTRYHLMDIRARINQALSEKS